MKCVDCGIELTTQEGLAGEVVEDDRGLHHAECVEPDAVVTEWKSAAPGESSGQAAAYAGALGLIEAAPGVFCADERSARKVRREFKDDRERPLDPDRRLS